jgi:hypothetical protein
MFILVRECDEMVTENHDFWRQLDCTSTKTWIALFLVSVY